MTELGPRVLPAGRHGEHLGRPVMTWLDPELVRRLTVEANKREMSRSAFIRRLLAEGLEHLRPADRAKLTRQTYR